MIVSAYVIKTMFKLYAKDTIKPWNSDKPEKLENMLQKKVSTKKFKRNKTASPLDAFSHFTVFLSFSNHLLL